MTIYYNNGQEEILCTMNVGALLDAFMKANGESVSDIQYAEFLPDWYFDDNLDDDVWVGSWNDVLNLEVRINSAENLETVEWEAARGYLDFHHVPIIAVWTKNHLYTSDNLEMDSRGEITVKKLRRKINFSDNEPIFDDYATWKTVVPESE